MSLIPCPACGHQVSDQASACPMCAHPIAKQDPAPRDSSPADDRTIADPEFHGRGDGIFMKSLNCGCVLALALTGCVVLLFVIAALND